MDDRLFDEKTAREWISVIERPGGAREADIYPRLRAWVEQVSPSALLEIGAGQGACSAQLEGVQYTGVEPSPFLVNRANELHSPRGRRFVLGNAYRLPFPENSFDAAFSVAVWHLLSNLRQAATELARVLRVRGEFLLITANPGAYALWTGLYASTRVEGKRLEGELRLPDGTLSRDVLYLHSLGELTGSLQEAGLEITEAETFRGSGDRCENHFFLSIRGRSLA